MKKIIIAFFLYNSAICLDVVVIPTTIVIIADQLEEIDKINKEEKKQHENRPSNCPSGSSRKVKIALISASATVISAVIYLIIHLTK